jgi:hypothetical protein
LWMYTKSDGRPFERHRTDGGPVVLFTLD